MVSIFCTFSIAELWIQFWIGTYNTKPTYDIDHPNNKLDAGNLQMGLQWVFSPNVTFAIDMHKRGLQ